MTELSLPDSDLLHQICFVTFPVPQEHGTKYFPPQHFHIFLQSTGNVALFLLTNAVEGQWGK